MYAAHRPYHICTKHFQISSYAADRDPDIWICFFLYAPSDVSCMTRRRTSISHATRWQQRIPNGRPSWNIVTLFLPFSNLSPSPGLHAVHVCTGGKKSQIKLGGEDILPLDGAAFFRAILP